MQSFRSSCLPSALLPPAVKVVVVLDCVALFQCTKTQRPKKYCYTGEQVQPLLIAMQKGPEDLIRQSLGETRMQAS